MQKVTISEEAYNEFKAFLEENNIDNFNIRIGSSGSACSGPVFDVSVDEAKAGDIVEKINDITFIMNSNLIDEFGGFVLLSSDENEGRGLSLRPLIEPAGGCSTCAGCH